MTEDAKRIIRLIAKFFEPPCQYEFGDVDAYDFINSLDPETGIEWCEEHCGNVSNYECWYRFLSLMQKAEGEQMGYGGGK